MTPGALLAIADLHVEHRDNRKIVEGLRPLSDSDWLIVCGDVADTPTDVEWALGKLRSRFPVVIWVPGNHELLVHRGNSPELRGEARYRHLVEVCRRLDVLTPEDPYPIWNGNGGPVQIAPLFVLYDYSFGRNVGANKRESLRRAHDVGVVCVDEFLLHPDPYPSREAWCEARVVYTEGRLAAEDAGLPRVLVNHFPLVVEPTRVLRHPEFALWCGTTRTANWHRRFRAAAVVYGHLHIPRTTWYGGVRFEEVSIGYPRERPFRASRWLRPRQIFPAEKRA